MKIKDLNKIQKYRKGLKVQLKNDTDLQLVIRTLTNHGINNIDNYIYPTDYNETDISKIKNIEKVNVIENHIKNGKSIAILADVDVDGICSTAMLANYFKRIYPKADIHTILPNAKLHGINQNFSLIENDLIENGFDILIAPDSSSNDIKGISKLTEKGINVVVIDHHIIESDTKGFNIINNQDNSNKDVNKNFTGVGMVYMVLKYLDKQNNRNIAKDFLDLYAIGQIADMSDISNLEIRSYMLDGLNHINNSFLKNFIQKKYIQVTPKGLAFSIIPLINSVMRIGTHEDRLSLLTALTTQNNAKNKVIKKRTIQNHHFKYIDKKVSIHDYVIHRLEKIKREQDKSVKNAIDKCEYLSNENDNVNVVVIPNMEKGISGLIGNKIMNGKPTFILVENGYTLTGSMRIPAEYKKSIELIKSNLSNVLFVAGHENAAGVKFGMNRAAFKKINIPILNKLYKPVDKTYLVDEVYIDNTPNIHEFNLTDRSMMFFGGKVKEPLIAILGLKISFNSISIKNNVLHINHSGIDIIQFNVDSKFKEYVDNNDLENHLYIDVVGNIGINRFLGKETPQIIIEDMAISDPINYVDDLDNLVF